MKYIEMKKKITCNSYSEQYNTILPQGNKFWQHNVKNLLWTNFLKFLSFCLKKSLPKVDKSLFPFPRFLSKNKNLPTLDWLRTRFALGQRKHAAQNQHIVFHLITVSAICFMNRLWLD